MVNTESNYINELKKILSKGNVIELQSIYDKVDDKIDLTDEANAVYSEREDSNPQYMFIAIDIDGESSSVVLRYKRLSELKSYLNEDLNLSLSSGLLDNAHNEKEAEGILSLIKGLKSPASIEGFFKSGGDLVPYVLRLEV